MPSILIEHSSISVAYLTESYLTLLALEEIFLYVVCEYLHPLAPCSGWEGGVSGMKEVCRENSTAKFSWGEKKLYWQPKGINSQAQY